MAVLPVDVTAAVATTGQAGRKKRGDGKAATGFLAPSMLGLLAFTAFPIVASLILGFYNWPVIGGHTFTGLKNYQTLLDQQGVPDGDRQHARLRALVRPAQHRHLPRSRRLDRFEKDQGPRALPHHLLHPGRDARGRQRGDLLADPGAERAGRLLDADLVRGPGPQLPRVEDLGHAGRGHAVHLAGLRLQHARLLGGPRRRPGQPDRGRSHRRGRDLRALLPDRAAR